MNKEQNWNVVFVPCYCYAVKEGRLISDWLVPKMRATAEPCGSGIGI